MGGRVAEGALEPPPIEPRLRHVWDAFTALSRRRQVGNAVGGIPFDQIVAWMDEAGIADPDDREDFVCTIEAMDSEFVSWSNRRAEREAKREAKKRGTR